MRYLFLVLLILVSVTGCASGKDYSADIADLKAQVKALQTAQAADKALIAQLSGNVTAMNVQLAANNKQVADVPAQVKTAIAAIPSALSVQDGMEIKSRLSAIEGQNLMFASRQTAWEGKANQQMMQYSNIIEQTRANLSGEFMTKADRLALVNQLYLQYAPRIQALEAKTGLPVGP